MRGFFKKIFLIIFGIILFLIILELSLRFLGFVHLALQEYRNRISLKDKDTYRIVCLGESTTFGYDESYPAQLEKILNQNEKGIKFRVINLGRPGVDSSFILEHLEEDISKYRPQLVITMIGINDRDITLLSKNHFFSKIKIFLRNFKIYKIVRLLIIHMRVKLKELNSYGKSAVLKNKADKPYLDREISQDDRKHDWNYVKLGWYYKEQGNYNKAEEMFKKAIETDPLNDWAYVELAQIYRQKNRNSEAECLFKEILELNPSSYWAYIGWGGYLFDEKRYEQAEEIFKKAIQIKPDKYDAYLWLGQTYLQEQKFQQAKENFEKVILLDPHNERAYSALIFLSHLSGNIEDGTRYTLLRESIMPRYYYDITYKNYRKLNDILKRKKIKLVCVQYPMRSIKPLKEIFKDTKDIVFVDNEHIFKEAVKKEGYATYFTDIFAGDFGHCTPKGNRLLAQNIANVILKEYFNE